MPVNHRRRWPWVLLAVVAVLAVSAAVAWWQATRPPKAVSVSNVLNKYRAASPSAHPTLPASAPAAGVYVYATRGSERISAGVTHRYPPRTTVTITPTGCGLQVRWDALSGRWSRAQLCTTGSGWRLATYTDVHKFLYMQDVHVYTCAAPTPAAGGSSTRCQGTKGVVTSTLQRIGTEQQPVAGTSKSVAHVRITQSGTGASTSTGTIDAWLLPTGLPARVEVTNHGAQVVLGSSITYDERASFVLTSLTPRR